MKIEINDNRATAHGPLPVEFLPIIIQLSGKKKWSGRKAVTFDATRDNLQVIKNSGIEFDLDDATGRLEAADKMEALAFGMKKKAIKRPKYKPLTKPTKEQAEAIKLGWDKPSYAFLLDMGLGKTWITLTNIGMLFAAKEILGAVIIAPSGVDDQWMEEELPKHFDPAMLPFVRMQSVQQYARTKKGKKVFDFGGKHLNLLFMTTDGVRSKAFMDAVEEFSEQCRGDVLCAVDESHKFKTSGRTSQRTSALLAMRDLFKYRRIMTGTLIGKSLEDAFFQFMFLDPEIFGYKYVTPFRARFCVTRPVPMSREKLREFKRSGRNVPVEVVGSKNVEEFYQIIAPYCYRKTKEETGIRPPIQRQKLPYSMGKETRKRYEQMRDDLIAQIDSGEIVSAANAMVGVQKLQQILSGFISYDDPSFIPDPDRPRRKPKVLVERFSTERAEFLAESIAAINAPVVIWCQFHEEIEMLRECIPLHDPKRTGKIAVYTGKMTKAEKRDAKAQWLSGEKNTFLSITKAGGTGLNLQGAGLDVFYFGHDASSINRRQSEDRSNRRGAHGAVTAWDVIAKGTYDVRAVARHRSNEALSSLALDDIRQMLIG